MMPAWNAEEYIAQAIKSVLNQTHKDWELCIVDDGSTDKTATIIKWFQRHESRIKFQNIEHQGCPTARNKCLEMMSGQIYARLDADDVQDPERIATQVSELVSGNYDIVTCGMTYLKNGVKVVQRTGPMVEKQYLTNQGGRPVNASIIAWKDIYDKVGGFNINMLAGSDGDWNFRAIKAGAKWGYVNRPMYHQRRHNKQISVRLRDQQRAAHEKARNRTRTKEAG